MKHLVPIFVLISFLAGVIAPACGFSWGGKYSVIEICTSEGIESRVVENTQNGQNKAPDHETSEQCQFCFQNANLKDSLPALIATNKAIVTKQRIKHAPYNTVFINTRKSPQSSRGPPPLI